jgi:hypothetical protein
MVIGRGGNWAKWLGGEMAKGRIGYGQNGRNGIGRNGKWAKWHWAKWEYTLISGMYLGRPIFDFCIHLTTPEKIIHLSGWPFSCFYWRDCSTYHMFFSYNMCQV